MTFFATLLTIALFQSAPDAKPDPHAHGPHPSGQGGTATPISVKTVASPAAAKAHGPAKPPPHGQPPHSLDTAKPAHAAPGRPKGILCGNLPAKMHRWKARQGPLTLAGTVVIGPGATLVVGEGTEIRVAAGDSCPEQEGDFGKAQIALIVRGGTLRLEGSSLKPVVFRSLSTARGFGWEGVRIEKASKDNQADLRWFEISRASIAVAFLAGSGRLEHGVIEGCGIGITSVLGASPSIRHTVLARNAVADLISSRSATRVSSCLFLDGEGDGIRFDGIGLSEIRSSCFWNQRGAAIINGPPGLGDWSTDTLPDVFGNWQRDPVLRDTPEHHRLLAEHHAKMSAQPWWKPRRAPENPPGHGPWSLSPFSPLVDKDETRFCADSDGSKCDIGLWGGR